MDPRLVDSTYIFDFSDELEVLKSNPNFILTYEQYDDLVHFMIAIMDLNISSSLEQVLLWATDKKNMPSNYDMLSDNIIDNIRNAMYEVVTLLWTRFHRKNMFDTNNVGTTSFPFVLADVISTNLVLFKDNVISSNEVNPYG